MGYNSDEVLSEFGEELSVRSNWEDMASACESRHLLAKSKKSESDRIWQNRMRRLQRKDPEKFKALKEYVQRQIHAERLTYIGRDSTYKDRVRDQDRRERAAGPADKRQYFRDKYAREKSTRSKQAAARYQAKREEYREKQAEYRKRPGKLEEIRAKERARYRERREEYLRKASERYAEKQAAMTDAERESANAKRRAAWRKKAEEKKLRRAQEEASNGV